LPSTRVPLRLDVGFAPHTDGYEISYVTEAMGRKNKRFPFVSIEQTVDMIRSRSVEFLICQPEVKDDYLVCWYSRHGNAYFRMLNPRIDIVMHTLAPEASGRYNTRSAAAKRKRS